MYFFPFSNEEKGLGDEVGLESKGGDLSIQAPVPIYCRYIAF